MTEELNYKLYTPTDCIPEQTMFDYIDNKLSPKEQHAVEKHMLDCELCSDAMEGLRMVKDRSRIAAINQKVSERMAAPADKKGSGMNYGIIMSIAAGLILLIGSVFFFDFFITNKEADVAELKQVSDEESPAINKKLETEASPAVPLEESPPPPPVAETRAAKDNANPVTATEEVAEEIAQQLNAQDHLQKPQATAGDIATGSGTTIAGDATTITLSAPESRIVYNYSTNKIAAKGAKQESTPENAKDLDEVPEKTDKELVIANSKSKYYEKENQAKTAAAEKKTEVRKEEKRREKTKSNDEKGWADQNVSETENSNIIAYAPKDFSKNDRADNAADSIGAGLFGDSESLLKTIPDEQPKYPGGETEMRKFIAKNFQYNTTEFKSDDIKRTKIFIEFTVDKTGLIKNAKIKKGINETLDKEALRVVNAMPKWIPALKDGKAIDAVFILPLQIELN